MRFLHDYPTLDKLEKGYPGFWLKSDSKMLITDNTVNSLEHAVPRAYLASLRSKGYPDGEILYGLRILFGVGKGRNRSYLNLHNGIILKHGIKGDTAPGSLVKTRITRCLFLAREMTLKAWREIGNKGSLRFITAPRQDKLEPILDYHLGKSPRSNEIIKETYRKIHAGLSDHLIIADAERGEEGYVDWPCRVVKRSGNLIRSPFETYGVAWDLHEKSIQFYKNNHHALKVYASMLEVEPTIEAVFASNLRSIHLDFDMVSNQSSTTRTDIGIASAIIHEASHKFASTIDDAYIHEPEYPSLSRERRLINADCYTYAAASLYCNRLIKNENDSAIST